MTLPPLHIDPPPRNWRRGDAAVSECGRYRYMLSRLWGIGSRVTFVMLNPSTADAATDDPTIRKCVGFAKRWGFGGLYVANLWAYRATSPNFLRSVIRARRANPINTDPVGPDNDQWIMIGAKIAQKIVVAWGGNNSARPLPGMLERSRNVYRILIDSTRAPIECLGTNQDGSPRHPLYVPYATPLQNWDPDK